ncbi:hypothetical protein [Pimelobacter simplex]
MLPEQDLLRRLSRRLAAPALRGPGGGRRAGGPAVRRPEVL